MMSPLPSVPKALEQFVEDLSSDNSSNVAIVVLELDIETRTFILSLQLGKTTEVNGLATVDSEGIPV